MNELKQFLSTRSPTIVCITETHLHPHHTIRVTGYQPVRKDRGDGFGGLLFLISNQCQFRTRDPPNFGGGIMEHLGIDIVLSNRWIPIVLLYNPCASVSEAEFTHFLNHVVPQGIVLGDLNAHHSSWEPSKRRPNPSGISLFRALNASPHLMLLNPPDSPTRQDPATGVTSNLDIFIASSLFYTFKFEIGPDIGSDHFPVTLSSTRSKIPKLQLRPRWALKQVTATQWDAWSEDMGKASIPRGETASEAAYHFENSIRNCAKNHFKIKTSATPRRPGNVWWDESCEKAVKARRRMKKITRRYPNPSNLESLNRLTERAKETSRGKESICRSLCK